jgi:DNA-binding CsgD family transcriptional regulator
MRTGLDSLTEHQRDMLRLYIEEASYKGVAHRLDLSVHTVRNQLQTIYRRLDVQSITQACVLLDRAER